MGFVGMTKIFENSSREKTDCVYLVSASQTAMKN